MCTRVWFGLWRGGCQGCVQATLLSMQVTPGDTEPRSGGARSAPGSVLGALQRELVRSSQCSREQVVLDHEVPISNKLDKCAV